MPLKHNIIIVSCYAIIQLRVILSSISVIESSNQCTNLDFHHKRCFKCMKHQFISSLTQLSACLTLVPLKKYYFCWMGEPLKWNLHWHALSLFMCVNISAMCNAKSVWYRRRAFNDVEKSIFYFYPKLYPSITFL